MMTIEQAVNIVTQDCKVEEAVKIVGALPRRIETLGAELVARDERVNELEILLGRLRIEYAMA